MAVGPHGLALHIQPKPRLRIQPSGELFCTCARVQYPEGTRSTRRWYETGFCKRGRVLPVEGGHRQQHDAADLVLLVYLQHHLDGQLLLVVRELAEALKRTAAPSLSYPETGADRTATHYRTLFFTKAEPPHSDPSSYTARTASWQCGLAV